MKDILEKAAQIKLVIFDVDGVLTDGSLFLGDDGLEYKAFNSHDGHGMKMLQQSGVDIAIITGRTSKVVEIRMASLGINHVYQGQLDKNVAYNDILEKLSVSSDEIAYVGDDVVDLPVMTKVGLAIAVENAHSMVKQHAHWTTPRAGGRGAARDVCELLMEAQGKLHDKLQSYLK
jgi:3-deoxy-D-manno-octulosonate 8-phosphate phosphatase (KDO 8-P phosphatase)